jgi:hypothetical protein
MIARIARLSRAVLVLPLALALAGFGVPGRAKPAPAPPTPAYNPPPSEESPFSRADAFCVQDLNRFETVASTDPQLRSQPAEVVWLVPAGPSGSTPDGQAEAETFARLVERCGGIGGRPFALHVVQASGNPGADCSDAVDRFHPVIVVSSDLPSSWSCIVHDRRTVLLTGADVSNADLTGAGGRLVATGSSEGIEPARLLALVESGRLDGRKVAIVGGSDARGTAFADAARSALATKHLVPVPLAAADTVLVPSLDLGSLPLLEAATAPTPSRPLDVYSIDDADASVPTALEMQPDAMQRLLRVVNLYAFSPVTAPMYRASQSPNTFTRMCNGAAVDEAAKRAGTTTTTTEPRPPLDSSYLTTADVCLLARTVARGLFAAGPTLDQRAVITALHRLPFVDQAAPGGTPKPRPNQLVNEPVRRIEQTVVLAELQPTCPSPDDATTTTGVTTPRCWMPAPGWDDGGRVVNVPLPTAAATVKH